MSAWVDLHCHWLPGVDDGARTLEETRAMLTGLGGLGFSHVVATPHLRPGMFDGTPEGHWRAFGDTLLQLGPGKPALSLGSEHFFDPIVVDWIRSGRGLPYGSLSVPAADAVPPVSVEIPRKGGAILLEFRDLSPPGPIGELLSRLRADGFLPVIAHPERYPTVWETPETALAWLDQGASLLLDLCAVLGKYGQRSQETALELLELDAYDAACTDSHRPADIPLAGQAIEWMRRRFGADELERLLGSGPQQLLQGNLPK